MYTFLIDKPLARCLGPSILDLDATPATTNAPPPLAIGSQRNKQNLTTAQKLQHSLPAMSAPTPSRPEGGRRTSTMHKRASILPKHPALFTDPTCLIAQHAGFTGTQPITVGPNVVLHPHAKVSSTLAPVVLGEGVVLWERAKVGVGMGESMNDSRRNSEASRANSVRDSSRGEGTVLGRNVTVEATAVVEAAEVGEGTVIEVGAYLGKGCVIGKVCDAMFQWNADGSMLTGYSIVPLSLTASFRRTRKYRITWWCRVRPNIGSTRRCCSNRRCLRCGRTSTRCRFRLSRGWSRTALQSGFLDSPSCVVLSCCVQHMKDIH